MANESPESELKKIATDFKAATDEVKSFAEKSNTELKNLGKLTDETKQAADKALETMNGMQARLTEIEQKVSRRNAHGGDGEPGKTLGQMVLENEEVKAFLAAPGNRKGAVRVHFDLETKTVINLTSGTATVGTGVSPATSLVVPDRQAFVELANRRLVVRDLLTPGQTNSANIEYPVEVSYQNMAAPVAEAGAKPKSDMTFDLKSAPVRTIATYVKASRQILDDAPQLQSYIDGRLRYFLGYAEEIELLTGDGTGQHILGIIPQATAYSAAFAVTGETAIDRLRLASLQATLALYPSTGYVLHPTDWAKVEMTKDGMGRYIVGDPNSQMGVKRLWGLPVVDTQAQPVTTFTTGAFKLGAQIFDRMGIEVLISTENEDDFIKNLITIRAEERLALAVYRPTAFVTGSLP